MKNKILFIVVIILFIITLAVLFDSNKTNQSKKEQILVTLQKNDEQKKLPLQEYLIGVVGAEMPASFDMEALKTQAIISRTFALYKMQSKGYVTTSDQAYLSMEELKDKWQDNFEDYIAKIKESVLSTSNIVILYNNQLIKSYFYSMSNGYTEDSSFVFNETLPYIEVVSSPEREDNTKKFIDTKEISQAEFCESLNIECQNITITDIVKDQSNRVDHLKINDRLFLGIEIRKKFQLRSTDFDIKISDPIIFTTRGYGHGVGLSQYGANLLAKNNYNYKDIINYYYKNVEISEYQV